MIPDCFRRLEISFGTTGLAIDTKSTSAVFVSAKVHSTMAS